MSGFASRLGYILVVVVLLIVALLFAFVGLASPATPESRLSVLHQQWRSVFLHARSESLRLQAPVHFCPLQIKSNNLHRHGCQFPAATHWHPWSRGVLVYADRLMGHLAGYDAQELLREWRLPHSETSWRVFGQHASLSSTPQGLFTGYERPVWVFQHHDGICLRVEWDAFSQVLHQCFGQDSQCFQNDCL